MAYIGNIPAESYASFETETFSVSATTNYTLSHAVTNENEIRLVINGVVQQPGSGKAYTASGTTLTLTSATVSGDSMYAVYLGRALQTVNPPNASVGTAQISSSARTTNLLYPAFEASLSSEQTVSDASATKAQCNTENFDTDGAYDNSTNYRFTPQVAGKYYVYGSVATNATSNYLQHSKSLIYKNGSVVKESRLYNSDGHHMANTVPVVAIVDMNGSTDYLELFGFADNTSGSPVFQATHTYFGAYRIGA